MERGRIIRVAIVALAAAAAIVPAATGFASAGQRGGASASYSCTDTLTTASGPGVAQMSFNDAVTCDPYSAKCLRNRLVILRVKVHGVGTTTLASTKTDANGLSQIVISDPVPGTYFESLRVKRYGRNKHKGVCYGGKSNEVELAAPIP